MARASYPGECPRASSGANLRYSPAAPASGSWLGSDIAGTVAKRGDRRYGRRCALMSHDATRPLGRTLAMARDIAGDIRLDPRVKAFLADDEGEAGGDVDSREALLAEANSEEARAGTEEFRQFMERFDTEEAAPSADLRVHTEKATSQPDGNTINLQVIRPDNDETLPCVYYIHGGGMGIRERILEAA